MIRPIPFSDIKQYQKLAERSGLCFSERTKYFANFHDDNLVGFFGILFYTNKLVIKNIFIFEKHRKKGYFKEMLDFILASYQEKKIEATCTDMSLQEFLKKGFLPIKKYHHYTKVVRL